MKRYLTEKEFQDFVETARDYLDNTILNEDKIATDINTNESRDNVEKQPISIEPKVYDWSKHEKFTEYDIINGKPERIKQLLRLDFTPRPYQIRMARAGLKRKNSLICLQTGAGKTFVRVYPLL